VARGRTVQTGSETVDLTLRKCGFLGASTIVSKSLILQLSSNDWTVNSSLFILSQHLSSLFVHPSISTLICQQATAKMSSSLPLILIGSTIQTGITSSTPSHLECSASVMSSDRFALDSQQVSSHRTFDTYEYRGNTCPNNIEHSHVTSRHAAEKRKGKKSRRDPGLLLNTLSNSDLAPFQPQCVSKTSSSGQSCSCSQLQSKELQTPQS
jgi:hypothetical protein